jgi:homotetrameric cytidine deaminase
MNPETLYDLAKEAAQNAVCTISGFPVGAALVDTEGRVYKGCNVESPSLIQVFCAERVALLKALSEGARQFVAIALYTPKAPGASPCGVCRQMLFEFAPGLTVIRKIDGHLTAEPIEKLLPDGFRLNPDKT